MTSTDEHHETRPRRIEYTRHTKQEYLEQNLARLAERKIRRAEARNQPRTGKARLVYLVALGISVALGTLLSMMGATTTQTTNAQIAALSQQLAEATLPTASATATVEPTSTSTAKDDDGKKLATEQLQAAKKAGEQVAEIQNTISTQERIANDDEATSQEVVDGALSQLNSARTKLGKLFAASTQSWTEQRLLGWAAVGAYASEEGDPRLAWTSEGVRFSADGGCQWQLEATSATSLVSSSGIGEGLSVLWQCLDTDGEPLGWASAIYDEGQLTNFTVGRLTQGAQR